MFMSFLGIVILCRLDGRMEDPETNYSNVRVTYPVFVSLVRDKWGRFRTGTQGSGIETGTVVVVSVG